MGCYFHSVKIISNFDVMSCIARSVKYLKETPSKTKENKLTEYSMVLILNKEIILYMLCICFT